MDVNDIFGQGETKQEEYAYKEPRISPFDFLNSITFKKDDLMVDDWSEKQYIPFVVNKGLSFTADTVIPCNEMNSRPHLDKKLQYNFLINNIRSRKRYTKWIKAEKLEDLEIVKECYGYSTEKAKQVLPLLSSTQIELLKQKLEKGGVSNVR